MQEWKTYSTILQCARRVLRAQFIQQHLIRHMDAWNNNQHQIMPKVTVRTCGQYIVAARGENKNEKRARMYTSFVLHRNLRSAVRWITDREWGGMFQMGKMCTKIKDTPLQVLRLNHP